MTAAPMYYARAGDHRPSSVSRGAGLLTALIASLALPIANGRAWAADALSPASEAAGPPGSDTGSNQPDSAGLSIGPGGSILPGGTSQPEGNSSSTISRVPVEDYQRRVKDLDDRLNELLSIPTTPAAFALGVSPETVAHPGTVRDVVAAVTTHFGTDGSLKPGLAVEGAPFRPLFARYDIDEWMKNATWPMQVLDSVRISFATSTDPAAPAGATAATLASAGLRVSLWDQRDYRHQPAFVKGVREALRACFPGEGSAKPGEGGRNFTSVPVTDSCERNLGDTLDKLAKTLTRGHRLELAGVVTIAQGQPATAVDWRASRLWLAYDWGFGAGTLGAAADAQFRNNTDGRRVTDLTVGLRALIGGESVKWSVGGLYGRVGQTPDQTDNVLRYGSALSLKVMSYGVVEAGIQGNHDFATHADGALLLVSLSAANGETVFSRAYSAGAGLP